MAASQLTTPLKLWLTGLKLPKSQRSSDNESFYGKPRPELETWKPPTSPYQLLVFPRPAPCCCLGLQAKRAQESSLEVAWDLRMLEVLGEVAPELRAEVRKRSAKKVAGATAPEVMM